MQLEASTNRVVDNMTRRQMYVLAVLSEKGGAGKTTTVIHVAVAALLMGREVVVLDMDPQASAADWCDQRGGKPEGATLPAPRLEGTLSKLRANEVDLAIADTPREANNISYVAAQAADLVIVPLKAGGFDYRALIRTLEICHLAKKTPFVVLNGIKPGAHRIETDARESVVALLEKHFRKTQVRLPCEVCPVVIHEWASTRDASITTTTALEAEPDSAAAAEFRHLYLWINQQFELSTPQQVERATA